MASLDHDTYRWILIAQSIEAVGIFVRDGAAWKFADGVRLEEAEDPDYIIAELNGRRIGIPYSWIGEDE